MAYDELELDRIGDRKTAVFFIISDTTQTYNFLVALAFSQMFNLLCERADNVHGGRLPHHVRVLWDEAANTGQVPQLEKLVAVIRSREVSLCLLYQQLAQCKAIYDKHAETILGNMDSVVFLGGREASTIKEISENWLAVDSTAEGTANTQSDAAKAEATEADTQQPQMSTIVITATGDCTLGNNQEQSYDGSFNSYYDSKGQDYFFGGVRDIFEADDMTLINLECVLSDATERVEKRWNLKGKPEYIGIMTGSSIEACSLGNNHTYDYGQQGLDDTRNVLDNAGIVYGFNDHTGIYETADGTRIGIVSVSLLSQNGDREAYIQNGIAQLREQGAAIVIACCHWGIEGDHYPNDYQQAAAHRIIDWGADLVVGNHPHVLQGMEVYNGKMICYSLGNFCFGGNKNPADKNTAIYQQAFTLINGELQPGIDARIIPCTLSSVSSYNDFRPTVASGEKAQEICNLMNTYSQNCSNIEIDELGNLHVN